MSTAPGPTDPPTVPGYALGELIGRGSSGTVWSATRELDGHPVALKVVPVADGDRVRALGRELTVLSRVRVEGLVGLHEAVGLHDPPAVALVLDHLAGGSLEGVVRARGHLSTGESVTVLTPVARALAGLHGLGVVHGDVSPGNVLLARTGQPFLADLGVARVMGEVPGSLWGTPGFVAPEVLDLGQLTAAADVYAVGALAWWCVTGRAPEPAAVRPPLERLAPGIPDGWAEVTRRSLSGDPALRPTAAEQALAYFDSAPCEPLRLVLGTDEAALLTHRLRLPPAPPGFAAEVPTRSRRRPTRRQLTALVTSAGLAVGMGYAGLVAADVLARPGWLDRPRAATPSAQTSAPDRRPARTITAGPSARAAPTAPPVRRTTAPVPQLPPAPRGTSTGPAPADPGPLADHAAPSRDALGLVVALAALRADVMTQPEARLEQLDAPGSPALAQDRALLADLARSGSSWRGVRFDVVSARTIAEDSGTATVDAVVATAAYQVVEAGGAVVRRAADRPRPMRFELVWSGGRWKVGRIVATGG